MTRKPLGAACAISADGTLEGLVTDGDVRRMLQNAVDLDSMKCSDIMTRKPVCAAAEDSRGQAGKRMEARKSKLSVLPVISEGGKFGGLVRLHDIYQAQ